MFAKSLVSAGIAAALSFGAASSFAADVWVRVAPPEPRVEAAPAPRHGYQWVPGHWQWQRNRHVWHTGYWVRERPGYVYAAPVWVERNGQWQMRSGNWGRRDADRDGVPNGADGARTIRRAVKGEAESGFSGRAAARDSSSPCRAEEA